MTRKEDHLCSKFTILTPRTTNAMKLLERLVVDSLNGVFLLQNKTFWSAKLQCRCSFIVPLLHGNGDVSSLLSFIAVEVPVSFCTFSV